MTQKAKTNKQHYVIGLAGIILAAGLIGVGSMSKNNNETEEKQQVVEVKKKLTEDEQFKLTPVANLINSVKNRFEDEISKNRAQENAKVLIKEFIQEKSTGEVDDWGVFITNVSSAELKAWNEVQEEKFKVELKNMSENTDMKNVSVDEIAQNNPLYILQEKKIIQRELYEQWILIIGKDNDGVKVEKNDTNPLLSSENKSANDSVEKKADSELLTEQLTISLPKEGMEEDKLKINLDSSPVKALVPLPSKEDKEKADAEAKKVADLQKITNELEKAKAMEKDLALKKVDLNNELNKNTQSLKGIEDEIEKTKKELEKLENELKAIK